MLLCSLLDIDHVVRSFSYVADELAVMQAEADPIDDVAVAVADA